MVGVCVVVLLFLVACSPVPDELSCKTVEDCVPAKCCHSKTVVNKDYAPDCSAALCTLNCEPGTLDCGQGEISCNFGKCMVNLE